MPEDAAPSLGSKRLGAAHRCDRIDDIAGPQNSLSGSGRQRARVATAETDRSIEHRLRELLTGYRQVAKVRTAVGQLVQPPPGATQAPVPARARNGLEEGERDAPGLPAGHRLGLRVSSDDHPEIASGAPKGRVTVDVGQGGSMPTLPVRGRVMR